MPGATVASAAPAPGAATRQGAGTGAARSRTCALGWLHNINVREGVNAPDWRQFAMGAFFNDDWKVTPKPTVNLGVRWEVNRMPWEVNDKMGSYVREHNKIVLSSPPEFRRASRRLQSHGPIPDGGTSRLPALGDPDGLEQSQFCGACSARNAVDGRRARNGLPRISRRLSLHWRPPRRPARAKAQAGRGRQLRGRTESLHRPQRRRRRDRAAAC